ncbi:MAG: hypothetical protein WEC75_14045 [Dehalococcoidia bacterium]
MARMVRKQIYLDGKQDALLKQRARELKTTESDILRRGIEQAARAEVSELDHAAWQRELRFIRKRARTLTAIGARRSWTREELYDERLQRVRR